jgi:hypothetical protein
MAPRGAGRTATSGLASTEPARNPGGRMDERRVLVWSDEAPCEACRFQPPGFSVTPSCDGGRLGCGEPA